MKTKSIEVIYNYITNHAGYEVARKSFLEQLEWDESDYLQRSMASSYAMMMVATEGNKDESVKFLLKAYRPETLIKIMQLKDNEDIDINAILND